MGERPERQGHEAGPRRDNEGIAKQWVIGANLQLVHPNAFAPIQPK